TARQLANQFGVAIYKGTHPIVAGPGQPLQVIQGARPALGTGGSGDVLAGLCGAIAARIRPTDHRSLGEVAVEAAWRHQQAGEGLPVGAGASAIARRLVGTEFVAK
ncbi:MAG TPA: NAD(P)H-hydrate dehydratase, partial [Myxococcota bacterium]|nr:NAD(P)H-hydrate dehydratase [Myxococcota bacterium]